jgi:hypothetical protein
VCECESKCSVLPGRGSSFSFYKSKGRESLHTERERDSRDRVASPLRVGPNGPVDDDGGAPIPCLGATCAVRPKGTGGAGSSGRRMGDVRPANTGGVSPRSVLRLDPQPGGRSGRAVVACLLRRSSRRTSLPTLTPEVCPPAWPVVLWGP